MRDHQKPNQAVQQTGSTINDSSSVSAQLPLANLDVDERKAHQRQPGSRILGPPATTAFAPAHPSILRESEPTARGGRFGDLPPNSALALPASDPVRHASRAFLAPSARPVRC